MRAWILVWFCLLCIVGLADVLGQPVPLSAAEEYRNSAFEYFAFSPKSSIAERLKPAPPAVIKSLRGKIDEFTPYLPTEADKKIIHDAVRKLPPLCVRILNERLLAVYLVNNLGYGGLANGVDLSLPTQAAGTSASNRYCYMLINPNTLKSNISEWITAKDRTCFNSSNTANRLKIDCGTKLTGFHYVFIHESTHVVDYVINATPFVEMEAMRRGWLRKTDCSFTNGVWKKYNQPLPDWDFAHRNQLSFYEENGGRIRFEEAPAVYNSLGKTPFVSLYASLNWADDLAECLTFYHLTKELNHPYRIIVMQGAKRVATLEPMQSELVRQRTQFLKQFYE